MASPENACGRRNRTGHGWTSLCEKGGFCPLGILETTDGFFWWLIHEDTRTRTRRVSDLDASLWNKGLNFFPATGLDPCKSHIFLLSYSFFSGD